MSFQAMALTGLAVAPPLSESAWVSARQMGQSPSVRSRDAGVAIHASQSCCRTWCALPLLLTFHPDRNVALGSLHALHDMTATIPSLRRSRQKRHCMHAR